MTDNPKITEREARTMAVRNYRATHVGWLLATDSPASIVKGGRLYDALSPGDQTIAEQYRDYCLATYERDKS